MAPVLAESQDVWSDNQLLFKSCLWPVDAGKWQALCRGFGGQTDLRVNPSSTTF